MDVNLDNIFGATQKRAAHLTDEDSRLRKRDACGDAALGNPLPPANGVFYPLLIRIAVGVREFVGHNARELPQQLNAPLSHQRSGGGEQLAQRREAPAISCQGGSAGHFELLKLQSFINRSLNQLAERRTEFINRGRSPFCVEHGRNLPGTVNHDPIGKRHLADVQIGLPIRLWIQCNRELAGQCP